MEGSRSPTTSSAPPAAGGARALRTAGALTLLAVGAVHLQQVVANQFSQIPTIGTLFVLNFIGATVMGLGLLAPIERLAHRLPARLGPLLPALLAAGGAGLAATACIFLLISQRTPLFGFQEYGYRPAVIAALVSEALTALLLGTYAARQLIAARRGAGRQTAR